MSSYTLANLIQKVKNRLQDNEYSDDLIKEFLNDTQLEVLGEDKYQFLERVAEIPTEVGEAPLPYDYQSTLRIVAKTGGNYWNEVEYLSPAAFFSGEKKPNTYTIYGGRLYLGGVECEDDDCTMAEIRHFYLARPVEMTESSDTPTIPPEYSEILVLGALARAERARDNFDYAGIYDSKQDQLIVNMKLRFGPRQQGRKNRIRIPVRIYGED